MLKRFIPQAHFVGIGLSLVLLAAVAVVSFASWQEYIIASDATRQARATMAELKELITDVQDAESSQRGYLLTGNRQYLELYEKELPEIDQDLQQLEKPGKANTYDSAPTHQLEKLVKNKVGELRETVELENQGDSAAALARVKTNAGRIAMAQIRGVEQRLEDHQEDHLETTRTRARYFARISELTSTIGSTVVFIILFIAAAQIKALLRTRDRLNEELTSLAGDFRHLADSVPQMVWRTTANGSLEYVNQRWSEFVGGSSESGGEGWQDMLHPVDRREFVTKWRESLARREALVAECRLLDRLRGKYRWFLFRGTPVRDEQVGRWRWYTTYTDIEDQKTTELTLQRTNEDLQQFVFSASHDLQEPLRILMLYAQRVKTRSLVAVNEDIRRDLEFINEAAARMSSLVADLLTYTQVASSDADTNSVADANRVLTETLADLDSHVHEADASIMYGDLPKLPLQEIQLHQLFRNLIGNALKYRSPGVPSQIEIAARREGTEWIVSICDNGIGIDPAFHGKIFGIFKRLHTSAQYPGTGLGLAICKKIVERQNGRIWLESQLGKGSTFFFSLPESATDQQRLGV